jgi:cell division FtsZ-interacting protein ZapD
MSSQDAIEILLRKMPQNYKMNHQIRKESFILRSLFQLVDVLKI